LGIVLAQVPSLLTSLRPELQERFLYGNFAAYLYPQVKANRKCELPKVALSKPLERKLRRMVAAERWFSNIRAFRKSF